MAVVCNFKRQDTFFVRQFNVHLAGMGVLGDIGQGFLGSAVGRQLNVRSRVNGVAAGVHPLGLALQKIPAPWDNLATCLPALRASRERPANLDAVLFALERIVATMRPREAEA